MLERMIFVAALAISWGVAWCQTTQPAGPSTRPGEVTVSSSAFGPIFQLAAATKSGLRYSVELNRETMAGVVAALREKWAIRVCFEDLNYDRQADMVTVGAALKDLQEQQAVRPLTRQEDIRLKLVEQLLKRPEAQNMLFDVKSPRFSGKLVADTAEELLSLLTAQTPYAWGKAGAVYAIFPRERSVLAYAVKLQIREGNLQETVEEILDQRPASLELSLLIPQAANASNEYLQLPMRIQGFHGSAIEALCKTAEEVSHGVVWSLGGYKDARVLSLAQVRPPMLDPSSMRGAKRTTQAATQSTSLESLVDPKPLAP